jgi:3-oxoacyl-(acyl-carrier-protein) synthase
VGFTSLRTPRHDRIVITGFGCLTPLGNTRDALWDGYRASKSGIRRIETFDTTEIPVQIAGEVRGIDPLECFPPKGSSAYFSGRRAGGKRNEAGA